MLRKANRKGKQEKKARKKSKTLKKEPLLEPKFEGGIARVQTMLVVKSVQCVKCRKLP